MSAPPSRGSISLIGHLKRDPYDQAVWRQFVAKYGPVIFEWCRKLGLQAADAEDITQDTFAKMSNVLAIFDPRRGSFRGLLRVTAVRVALDLIRKRKEACGTTAIETALQGLHAREAETDLEQCLEKEFDGELWEAVQDAVRLRVATTTWESFRLTKKEGKTPAEASELLGIKKILVIRNVSRVVAMLKEEVSGLREQEDPTPS